MFGTSGIRGPVGTDVTAALALSLGRSLAPDTDRVVIGRDTRDTGRFLADALAAGLRECGTDVIRLGMTATPTIARSVAWQDADAGVAVTASHNPPPDNGFKLWQPSGQAFDEAHRDTLTTRIQQDEPAPVSWEHTGSSTDWQTPEERHRDAILTTTTTTADLSVVVDVGNGAGGLTASVLTELGCQVETLNAQPDGRFPARPSEPTPDHCSSLCHLVATTDADLGIAHDGDADRMLAVADDGTWIPGDTLLAIFARATATAGDRVAAPVDTSLAVDDTLSAHDISVTRTRVGDVYVAETTARPDVAFGGEPSGAWIWPTETLAPDGPLAAAKLTELIATQGPLSTLADEIAEYPIERTSLETPDKARAMTTIREQVLDQYTEVDTLDGVRVDLDDAWFLIRASGTQPLIRLTAEARTPERTADVFGEAKALVTAAIDRA